LNTVIALQVQDPADKSALTIPGFDVSGATPETDNLLDQFINGHLISMAVTFMAGRRCGGATALTSSIVSIDGDFSVPRRAETFVLCAGYRKVIPDDRAQFEH